MTRWCVCLRACAFAVSTVVMNTLGLLLCVAIVLLGMGCVMVTAWSMKSICILASPPLYTAVASLDRYNVTGLRRVDGAVVPQGSAFRQGIPQGS